MSARAIPKSLRHQARVGCLDVLCPVTYARSVSVRRPAPEILDDPVRYAVTAGRGGRANAQRMRSKKRGRKARPFKQLFKVVNEPGA